MLKTHRKRKLGHNDEPESTTEDPPSDNEKEDFSAIAHNLIIAAINDRAAEEAEDQDPSPPDVSVPISTQHGRRPTQRTQMPLATLFNFNRLDSGLSGTWMPRLMRVSMHSLSRMLRRLQTCKMLRQSLVLPPALQYNFHYISDF